MKLTIDIMIADMSKVTRNENNETLEEIAIKRE